MKMILLVLSVFALSSCATTHSKASRSQKASDLFDTLDVNHDGYLTRSELSAGLRYAGTPDLNPDLVIGLEKSAPAKKKIKASRKLSEGEIQKIMSEAFDKRDAKLDQRLSRDEFKKVVSERPRGVDEDPWEPFM